MLKSAFKINENPEKITLVNVEAVLMPNGEVIMFGKTIGWLKGMQDHVFDAAKMEKSNLRLTDAVSNVLQYLEKGEDYYANEGNRKYLTKALAMPEETK